jgi:hypothetical protein
MESQTTKNFFHSLKNPIEMKEEIEDAKIIQTEKKVVPQGIKGIDFSECRSCGGDIPHNTEICSYCYLQHPQKLTQKSKAKSRMLLSSLLTIFQSIYFQESKNGTKCRSSSTNSET